MLFTDDDLGIKTDDDLGGIVGGDDDDDGWTRVIEIYGLEAVFFSRLLKSLRESFEGIMTLPSIIMGNFSVKVELLALITLIKPKSNNTRFKSMFC